MKKIVLFIFVALFSVISNSESIDLNQIYSNLNQSKLKVLAVDLTVLAKKTLEFNIYLQKTQNFKEDVYIEKLKELNMIYDRIYMMTMNDEKLKMFSIGFITNFYKLTKFKYHIYLYEKLFNDYDLNARLSFSEHVDGFIDAVCDAAQETHEDSHADWPYDWVEAGAGAIIGGAGYIVGAIESEAGHSSSTSEGSAGNYQHHNVRSRD